MNRLMALPTWDDRSPPGSTTQLVLTTAVVHQLGTLRGEYDDARSWGDCALASGRHRLSPAPGGPDAAPVRDPTASPAAHVRSAELVPTRPSTCSVCTSCRRRTSTRWRRSPVPRLLLPGALADWEGRPDEARPLLSHAWSHGARLDPAPAGRWSTTLWCSPTTATTRPRWPSRDPAIEMADPARRPAGHHRRPKQPGLHAATPGPATTRRTPSSRCSCRRSWPTTSPTRVLTSCEDFACVLFDMGRDRDGALLVGAAMAERDGTGVPRMAFQEAAPRAVRRGRQAAARRRVGAPAGPWCRARRPRGRRHGAATRRPAERYFSS